MPSRILLLIFLSIISLSCSSTKRTEQVELVNEINYNIKKLESINNINDQEEKKDEITLLLEKYIKIYGASNIKNETIYNIAKLLSNNNYDIFAARLLSKLGIHAKRAVPSLENAVRRAAKKRDARDWIIGPSVSGVDEICKEISKITQTPLTDIPVCVKHMW